MFPWLELPTGGTRGSLVLHVLWSPSQLTLCPTQRFHLFWCGKVLPTKWPSAGHSKNSVGQLGETRAWTVAILNMGATPMVKVLSPNRSLYQICMLSCSVMSNSLRSHARFLCPWDIPGKKYWRVSLFPSPGDLLDPGIKPMSPAL